MLDTATIHLPDHVLDFTEGKRALICGGQGGREEVREKIQCTFGLIQLDWIYGEYGSDRYITQAQNKVLAGGYDLFLALVKFSSHQIMKIVRDAKKIGVPHVIINGYSPQIISQAIDEQICRDLIRKGKLTHA